jgi:hypothetical protein
MQSVALYVSSYAALTYIKMLVFILLKTMRTMIEVQPRLFWCRFFSESPPTRALAIANRTLHYPLILVGGLNAVLQRGRLSATLAKTSPLLPLLATVDTF